MFDASRKHGRLLMEGFMYRSHPQTHAVCRAVLEGRIGKLRMIRLSHVFSAAKVSGSIKFNKVLAGGSLMDVGCYCLSYARRCWPVTGVDGLPRWRICMNRAWMNMRWGR